MHTRTGTCSCRLLERARGSDDEVVLATGERRIVTGKRDVAGGFKRQLIGQIDAFKDRLDLVVAIRPFAQDAQVEVEFGRRAMLDQL